MSIWHSVPYSRDEWSGDQNGIMKRVYAESDGTWYWAVSNKGEQLASGGAASNDEAKEFAENHKGGSL